VTVLRATQQAEIGPVRPDELAACAAIWRRSINDYRIRLAQPEIPDDLVGILGLYRHLQASDPETFVVARRSDGLGVERIAGFASAVVRDDQWFLSMLFIEPEEQGLGLGRVLLERVMAPAERGMARAICTDSVQPIANALYSRYGIVPRQPLLELIGYVGDRAALPRLPGGVVAVPFEAIVEAGPGGAGHRTLAETVDGLDREIAGFAHPSDHRFLRENRRRGFLYRAGSGPDAAMLGYGYGSDSGRLGPIAIRDEALMGPVIGHLLGTFEPRGAFAAWVPGAATGAMTTLLEAGLRIEDFPVLVCWDRPTVDFARYLPISPGLL
jgi:GNAT superfamily N-acetyltransferase